MRHVQILAWERGMDGAAIPDMTPSEARGIFEGLDARRKRADEEAWALGRYIAIGVNAPKKYPSQPITRKSNLLLDRPDMTDDQMQQWAKAFAERWNENGPERGDAGNPDQSDE